MIFLAPEQPRPAPTPAPLKPVAVLDYFDCKLVEAIRQPDEQVVPLWPTIHEIIEGEGPADRARRRQLCSRLLCRLRGLIRAGQIIRESKSHVRLAAPSPSPSPASPPTSLPTATPVKNLPPALPTTVSEWVTFHGGGPHKVVFQV